MKEKAVQKTTKKPFYIYYNNELKQVIFISKGA